LFFFLNFHKVEEEDSLDGNYVDHNTVQDSASDTLPQDAIFSSGEASAEAASNNNRAVVIADAR